MDPHVLPGYGSTSGQSLSRRQHKVKVRSRIGGSLPPKVVFMATDSQVTSEAPAAVSQAEADNLQKRFDSLIEKRNELNNLARGLRDSRNLLNDQNKEFRNRMDQAKEARDRYNKLMREAKDKRNEYQAQAKELIAQKQKKTGDQTKSPALQARHLEKEIHDMEYRHQTQTHTVEQERDLLKALKEKGAELRQLKVQLAATASADSNLDDLDASINDLFKKADEAHAEVQKLHGESNRHHEAFVSALEEAKVVQKEANTKHKEYIAVREKADESHNKAMEMREELLTIRNERRSEREKSRQEINAFNNQARDALNSPEKRDELEQDAISMLKKGGKLSFGV